MHYDLHVSKALIVEEDGAWCGSLGVREGKLAARFVGAPDGPAGSAGSLLSVGDCFPG